jgi:hypothetical protein
MDPRHRSARHGLDSVLPVTFGTAKAGSRARESRSTSTVASDGHLVPWLAAQGPLSYSPENPPDRNYYFQYGWVLPGIFAEGARARRHYYFGAPRSADLEAFWACARRGEVDRVSIIRGSLGPDGATAPMAIYRTQSALHGRVLVLIQHGSYQLVRESDQPLLASRELMLYRGLQRSREFRHFQPGALREGERSSWRHFIGVQAHVLSDSVRSFNSVHDLAFSSSVRQFGGTTVHWLSTRESGSVPRRWKSCRRLTNS